MSDLKAMRTLLAIRDCGSLTMAADQLEEPKSTLSRRISILESELDERLTCQSGRRLSLTRAGLCYAGYCEQILQLEASGRSAIKALKSNLSGHLTIGLATELSRGWSTESLHNFTQHYPEIELEVQIMECSKLPQDPSLDLWISCCEAPSQNSGIKSKRLGYWQQGLYTHMAGDHNIRPDDLKTCHWICSHEETENITLRQNQQEWALTPSNKMVISSLHMRADAIAQGFGIGFLPCWVAECKRHGTRRYHRLLPDLVTRDITLWLHHKVEKESLIVNTLREWLVTYIPEKWKAGAEKSA